MSRRYRKSKREKTIIIIIIICLLIALLSLKVIFFSNTVVQPEKVYAGIGGAVNDGGVYEIFEDTRLFELILMAKGLHERANIKNISIEDKVIPWEVYCIPYLPKETFKAVITPKAPKLEVENPAIRFDTKRINFVYAGLPRTYLLISVYPDLNYITTTHIPWFTLATPEYEYPRTLYEVYLTGGIPFLLRGVQRITGETIDHYFTQNRPSWINFIDYLGGIDIDVPKEFAYEYNIQPGMQTINGLLAWQFISYISKQMRRENSWITGSSYRIKMQQEFMESLYTKFKSMNLIQQAETVKDILSEAETDMKLDDVIKLAFDINQLKNTEKDFLKLPGTIQNFDERRMWVSDLNEYNIKRTKLLYDEHSDQLQFKEHDKGGFGGKK
ncbi:MAG: hypothetical protein HOD64_05035 [Candidatus Cloacimonetes bacterium]|nr:hypothetical protein [Candidatus Cloacimonadota bacterium]